MQPIGAFLTQQGFRQVNYRGVTAWKKGMGFLTAPQYVVLSFSSNYVQLEAFIKYALFPGVYVGEMGLDGFFGAFPKANLRARVATIEQYIYGLWKNQQAGG